MNGWLLIDKPSGVSSHDVVHRARGIIPGCRIGHTGTLDPLATGLLVLGIGNTTRLSEYLISQPKQYTAVVRLGVTTTTFDADGDIMSEDVVMIDADEKLEKILLQVVESSFTRHPIFSGKQENIIGVLHAKELLKNLNQSEFKLEKNFDKIFCKYLSKMTKNNYKPAINKFEAIAAHDPTPNKKISINLWLV